MASTEFVISMMRKKVAELEALHTRIYEAQEQEEEDWDNGYDDRRDKWCENHDSDEDFEDDDFDPSECYDEHMETVQDAINELRDAIDKLDNSDLEEVEKGYLPEENES